MTRKMTLHVHHCELGSTSCLTLSAQWPVIRCVSRSKSIRYIIRCRSAPWLQDICCNLRVDGKASLCGFHVQFSYSAEVLLSPPQYKGKKQRGRACSGTCLCQPVLGRKGGFGPPQLVLRTRNAGCCSWEVWTVSRFS